MTDVKINVNTILDKYPKVFFPDSPTTSGTAIEVDDVKSAMRDLVVEILINVAPDYFTNNKCEIKSENLKDLKLEIIF